jgi:predicted metal-dependent enzyme (double-stranded beta helix superfamily)
MTAVLPADRSADLCADELTYLNPIQLLDYTRFVADDVVRGGYPFIDFDPDTRWHQRIYRDRRVDVWLISWLPTQGTQLHDHGGSAGAFTVVSGDLSETVFVGSRAEGTLREHSHATGAGRGFGAHYIHDVRNISTRPAVSVHAYSRPLTSMTFWDLDDGRLVDLATLATDDPETEFAP